MATQLLHSGVNMTLTGISNRGLMVIAILVTILWACIFTEHVVIQQARAETQKVLRSPERPVKYQKPPLRLGPSRNYRG